MASIQLPEQFIPDHVFVHLLEGHLHCYDGNRSRVLAPGASCLFRKNQLIKYQKFKNSGEPKFIRICFEEDVLKQFRETHHIKAAKFILPDAFIPIKASPLLTDFIRSLYLIYHRGEIDEPFNSLKQEELLLILLQGQPEIAGIFFDFSKPGKIGLEEFMNRNYQFNICLEQFAYLTGRSLSAFKRDFKAIFNQTPGRWLIQKRLEEAYGLIAVAGKKPVEIYLNLGFETLAHFSHAFKERFGITATELGNPKRHG